MNVILLLSIGETDTSLLRDLMPHLSAEFRARCEFHPTRLDPEFAFHAERQQYHSTEILGRMRGLIEGDPWRLLGVTAVDLYIPILTFVFGEATLGPASAVVSTYRLRQEFYGMPPDRRLLRERLLKEAVHELGHTLELVHCRDYTCAMASSHAVEWIDLKGTSLCQECRSHALP